MRSEVRAANVHARAASERPEVRRVARDERWRRLVAKGEACGRRREVDSAIARRNDRHIHRSIKGRARTEDRSGRDVLSRRVATRVKAVAAAQRARRRKVRAAQRELERDAERLARDDRERSYQRADEHIHQQVRAPVARSTAIDEEECSRDDARAVTKELRLRRERPDLLHRR